MCIARLFVSGDLKLKKKKKENFKKNAYLKRWTWWSSKLQKKHHTLSMCHCPKVALIKYYPFTTQQPATTITTTTTTAIISHFLFSGSYITLCK